eukprot:UC4_evm2s517
MAARTLLPTRVLGRTGLNVSSISLGGVGIGPSRPDQLYGGVTDDEAQETIRAALNRGINYIDTAPLYAESEKRIGMALRDLKSESSSLLEGLILSTKVGDDCPPYSNNGGHNAMSRDGVFCSFENSLSLLGVDYIDVLFLHDPTLKEMQDFVSPGGGIEALEELKRQNSIGHIGLGCLEHENHVVAIEDGRFDVILTVNDCNLIRRFAVPELYPRASKKNVGIINASIFYMGLIGGISPHESFSMGFKKELLYTNKELVDLATDIYVFCEKRGTSIRKAAIDFSLSHFPGVATVPVGCRTSQEVHSLVDDYEKPVLDFRFWNDFNSEFHSKIANFPRSFHWFYSKEDSQ